MFTMFLIWTLGNMAAYAICVGATFVLTKSKKFMHWIIDLHVRWIEWYVKRLNEAFD